MGKIKIPKPLIIILDFPKTVKPDDFKERILMPFFKNNLTNYLEENLSTQNKEVIDIIRQLRLESERDQKLFPDCPVVAPASSTKSVIIKTIVHNVNWLMNKGLEPRGLTRLRSAMWSDAYKHGQLKTEIYSDVPEALTYWKENGIRIFAFSSSPVQEQKVLMNYTIYGKLAKLIDFYFDSTIGEKTNPESYSKMAKFAIGSTMFITDYIANAKAALEAGLKVCVITRSGKPTEIIPSVYYINLLTNFVF
ncbi:enolase-phosphatase E1-like isoform X1 [Dinothrombium tinctorium]|uniref:Enolase-phosphatase E1-like isoform X1 n=1 Tax=Dinothrombium tinctorium TaxID=1965070 RepID=A0A443R2S2_9ACAR|nr:enolase-phosphatase E1-like isoform X1 [Dinothrombium tinctorium]